jgi:membrane-bound inhibitor of C-type lysozyme
VKFLPCLAWLAAGLLVGACSAQGAAEPRQGIVYRCGDGRSFTVEQQARFATVEYAGARFQLPRRKSSIGTRYASPDATLIVDGESAVFVTPHVINLDACRALRT